jgi:hypothetical protein
VAEKVTVKTLSGNKAEAEAESKYQWNLASQQEAYAEDLRGQLYSGLGSADQRSGALSGGEAPRDLSKYSQGFSISSPYGGTAESISKLERIGARGTREGGDLRRGAAGQILGQVREVKTLYDQSYAAAKAGNFDEADALRAKAEGLQSDYNLNENFASKKLKDWRFGTEGVYGLLDDTENKAGAALGSETGMLVGEQVHSARMMQDPNSAEATRFKDSLTDGAIQAIDQSRTNALRAQAADERGAGRAMRDAELSAGSASSSVRTAAVAARSAERFASQQTQIEGDVAAAKAQVYSAAGQMYEQFRVDLANNAVSLASAWVNDQSGVRDSFRQAQMAITTNYANTLSDWARDASSQALQLRMLQKQQDAAKSGWVDDTLGFVGGLLGFVAAGWSGGSEPSAKSS